MEKGDKVVFRKFTWFFPKRGTVIGINERKYRVAVRRLFRVYIVSTLSDDIVVYKRKQAKQL